MLKNALAMYLASTEHALHIDKCFETIAEQHGDEIKKIVSYLGAKEEDKPNKGEELRDLLLNFGADMYNKGFCDCMEMVHKGFSDISGEWLEHEVNYRNEM